MNRVMVSAMSVVSPIGTGRSEFFSGIEKTISGTGIITCFRTDSFPVSLGAEARRGGTVIAAEEGADRRELFNDIALDELFRYPSLDRYAPEERMLITGCGVDFFRLSKYAESKDIERHCWQRYSNNSCLMFARLAQQFNISGGTIVNASACVASSQAIGLAFRMLSKGDRKGIIAGGVDSMLNPLHYMGFFKLGALSDWKGDPEKSCRPFDRDRRGVVLGEGAAYYVLENGLRRWPGLPAIHPPSIRI
jgi:3-oxoacyl-[acyl-carrier-protein] synthase II